MLELQLWKERFNKLSQYMIQKDLPIADTSKKCNCYTLNIITTQVCRINIPPVIKS